MPSSQKQTRLTIKMTTNNQLIQCSVQIPFRCVRVTKLAYTPSADNTILKLQTGGELDQVTDLNDQKYLICVPTSKLLTAYTNEHQSSFDLCNDFTSMMNNFYLRVYEDTTLVSNSYLTANPLWLELLFMN